MNYTYRWNNHEQTTLERVDDEGNVCYFPTDPDNIEYAKFLSSGAPVADCVVPPDSPELTAEEKLARSGLSVEEIRTLLGLD